MYRFTILVLLLVNINLMYAQEMEYQYELGGFVLGQYRKCVREQLGPPINRIKTEDGWIYEFHKFKSDTSVYGLFKYAVYDTVTIYSIQINGHKFEDMRPFLGLKLGDPEDKLKPILGDVEKVETIDNPRVRVLYYANKNYSVEIDEKGNLYGIQIHGMSLKDPKEVSPSLVDFQNAISKKNIDSLIILLAPDIEIFKGNSVVSYVGSARNEFQDPQSELVKLLLGNDNSVKAVFEKEKAIPTPELRFYPDKKTRPNTSYVFKFYKSKIIAEIVYMAVGGKWTVYEIRFR